MQVWTIHEIRRPEGQAAIEVCCLLIHTPIILLGRWHNLPPAPYLGQK